MVGTSYGEFIYKTSTIPCPLSLWPFYPTDQHPFSLSQVRKQAVIPENRGDRRAYIHLTKLTQSPIQQQAHLLLFIQEFIQKGHPGRILQKDEIPTRIKCTKLLNEFVPKLGGELETCMSFVMPNILFNMGANNMVLKRESIRLIKEFAVRTPAKNQLVRSVIWEGIDHKDPAVAKEVIANLPQIIPNILQSDDCYDIIAALCKRFYLEDSKKVKKAIKDSFSGVTAIIGVNKMEVRYYDLGLLTRWIRYIYIPRVQISLPLRATICTVKFALCFRGSVQILYRGSGV
eukprot:sb/3467690/